MPSSSAGSVMSMTRPSGCTAAAEPKRCGGVMVAYGATPTLAQSRMTIRPGLRWTANSVLFGRMGIVA